MMGIYLYINMCAYVLFVGDAFLIFFISWQKHVQTWHVQPPQTESANSAMLAEPSAWRKPEKPRQGRNLSKPVKKNEAKHHWCLFDFPKKNMMVKHEPIISIWIISCFRLKSVLKRWNPWSWLPTWKSHWWCCHSQSLSLKYIHRDHLRTASSLKRIAGMV